MFPGFASRFQAEVEDQYKTKTLKNKNAKDLKGRIQITDSPRRKISVFIGAAVIANTYNQPSYEHYWISKEDWAEMGGENCIMKKCKNVMI